MIVFMDVDLRVLCGRLGLGDALDVSVLVELYYDTHVTAV